MVPLFAKNEPEYRNSILSFRSVSPEPGRYLVSCIPARKPDGSIQNWSLTQLPHYEFQKKVCAILPDDHSRTYYAPTVNAMSGSFIPPERFTDNHPISKHCEIKRPAFLRGSDTQKISCDATNVSQYNGFVMSAGGCPLLVLTATDRKDLCLVAHAGRDCLIDRRFIIDAVKPRKYFSVIDAMVAYMHELGIPSEDLILRSFFALPWFAFPHGFDDPAFGVVDPKYGTGNRAIYEYLSKCIDITGVFLQDHESRMCLSLSGLILRQAEQHRIPKIEVGIHDLPHNGDAAYTTHERPELAGKIRNLIVLIRE